MSILLGTMKQVVEYQKVENKERLKEIFASLINFSGIQIFVHGSWADSTRTPFSDLDDFIILDRSLPTAEQEEIQKRLDEVELSFQKIDPLQHHGHWLISKSDLEDYDNSYIPLFILQDAILLCGDGHIDAEINRVKSKEGLIRNIKNTCKNIEILLSLHEKHELNLYKLKGLVGSFLLLPPLIFQLKGQNINKREAILRSEDLFDEEGMQLIQWSTDLRQNWGRLLDHTRYKEFVKNIEKYNSASQWRSFANVEAPVLNYEELSGIKLERSLVERIVKQSLYYVDEQKFRELQLKDYTFAFHLIEDYAWENGAIAVGRFGGIKHPSVSDLDVFICFPDEKYVEGIKLIEGLISNNEILNYVFTHPPLYVSVSMLPWVKYLHTLYDLKITKSIDDFTLDVQLKKEYKDFYNSIWTLYILKVIYTEKKNNIKYFDSRFLLLLIKNIHTSIKNLSDLTGKHLDVLKKSDLLREQFLKKGIAVRNQIEETYKEAVKLLFDTLKVLNMAAQPKKKSFVVDRSLLFCYSDGYRIEKRGHKTIYYLGGYSFNIAYQLYTGSENAAQMYLKALRHITSIVQSDGMKPPFIKPFHKDLLEKDSKVSSLRILVKKILIFMLNSLPSSLSIYLFKRI